VRSHPTAFRSFEVDEAVEVVLRSELAPFSAFVLRNAKREVVGHAGVQGHRGIRDDVDGEQALVAE
jgi:hypothetical protein